MDSEDVKAAALGLALCPTLERGTLNKLVARLGGTEAVWHADPQQWQQAVRLQTTTEIELHRWRETFQYERAVNRLDSLGIWHIHRHDPQFPQGLLHLADPPLVLFGLGTQRFLQDTGCKIAVIGTRRASSYGLESAVWIGETLSQAGCTVVSGLALGIDGAAHKGALNGKGGTIAVLAGGVNVCYPPSHRNLYDAIVHKGSVVSEYPPGMQVAKHRFPERNRLIAALADALVVVQAGEKSGALRTVDAALELGKEVFAVPGPITSVHFRGSNRLLQQGAGVLLDPHELLADYNMGVPMVDSGSQLSGRLQRLHDSLMEPVSAATLAGTLQIPIANVYAGLLELELAGLVERGAGGFYQRTRGWINK